MAKAVQEPAAPFYKRTTMKESTIYKTFAVALTLLATAALVAVICGHAHHIFTLAATAGMAYILGGEADKLDKTENSKTIE